MHHSTLFSPPLPLHKLHSVQRMGFGTNNKIFVEFDSPWWDVDCEVIYLVWEDEVGCGGGLIKKPAMFFTCQRKTDSCLLSY